MKVEKLQKQIGNQFEDVSLTITVVQDEMERHNMAHLKKFEEFKELIY